MTTRFLITPKKIAQIDGTDPTIFDSGCPNCIAPAYSGPCLTQNVAFVPKKDDPSEDAPATPSEDAPATPSKDVPATSEPN